MRRPLAIIFTLFAATGIARAADKTYPEISHAELVRAVEARTVTLLDANGTKSYNDSHIPTALDFEAVKQNLAARLPKDRSALIVAYCANEDCPDYREAAEAAEQLGYTNVRHYAAGIMGWKESGARVETAK
jgi:rhodanese-related sulfurtransferase